MINKKIPTVQDRLKQTMLLVLLAVSVMLATPIVLRNNVVEVSASKTQQQVLNQIDELQRKLENTKKQAASLGREISIIVQNIELKTIQIKQAEYEIDQKEKELEALIGDIELLEVRLDRLDETIKYHESLLATRIKQQYIDKQHTTLELLISADSIGDFMAKLQYLQRIEAQDRELLIRMRDTKGNYEGQQDLLEKKKDQVEDIKKEIEAQKVQAEQLRSSLNQQNAQKKTLLSVTKNDEKRYKELLKDAEKELAQIMSAANVVIREGEGVDVGKGEVIGTMGNTGYSTGAHLHFGVYKYSVEDFQSKSNWGWYYSNYRDPLDKLKPKTVYWGTGCSRDPSGSAKSGNGDWEWPMESPRITQNYGGSTCYNWMYGGKVHPALDMVGRGDISIRSVDDGEAYFCRNCLKDGGNGVFIFHGDNYMTVYWHLR